MRTRSRSPAKHPNPLQIQIPNSLTSLFSDPNLLKRLKTEAAVDLVEFSKLHILSVSSLKLANKLHALSLVLEILIEQTPEKPKNLSITILIPEPAVPLLLGKNTSNLQKIQEKSFTEIKVNDRSNLDLYRRIEVTGRTLDIETAVKHILIITKIFDLPPELTSETFKSKLKFIIKHSEEQVLDENLKILIKEKFFVDCSWKNMGKEVLVKVVGGNPECKLAIEELLLRALNASEDVIRLVVPSVAVVKIIGPKGKLIKEICSNAGGARIIVLGDKSTAKEQKTSEVVVEGNPEVKLAAVLALFDLLDSIRKEQKIVWKQCEDFLTVGAVVPDRMVSKLIGKSGSNVRSMMDESDCSIAFLDNENRISTPEGEKGRMVSLKGNSKSISLAVQIMLKQIEKFGRDSI